MNNNKQIPLFQQGIQSWSDSKPNPDRLLWNCRSSHKHPQELKTNDIQKWTQLRSHELPPIGMGVCWQFYILFHQKRDCWLVYQQIST